MGLDSWRACLHPPEAGALSQRSDGRIATESSLVARVLFSIFFARFLGAHGYIGKNMFFRAMWGDRTFGCWDSSIRALHSLRQFRQNKPVQRASEKIGKHDGKRIEKENVDHKIYMRDNIGNISKILKYSTWDSAQEQLEKLSVRWDSYTVNQVLKSHPPMEKAWLFFNWASRLKGFKHDQFTYTTMLDIFGEARRIESMNYVFRQMQGKGIKIDAVTYTSLMHWFSNDGNVDGAVRVWKEMKAKGFHLTVVSYTAYMKILFDNKRVKEAADVYKEMLQSGCAPNCYTYTVLMEHLAGSGKYKAALEIFSRMQEAGVQPDKATCNILIEKFCKRGQTWAISPILLYMKDNFVVLRYPVYLEALETLRLAGESDNLLRQVNPHFNIELSSREEIMELEETAADADFAIDRGLLLTLLTKQNFPAIDCLLTGMIHKKTRLDSVIISRIIEQNCGHCRISGALLAFEYSMKMGINIERTAYLALVGVFIRTNSFPKVADIVEKMVRAGISLGTYLGALLIYKLGCARRPGSAAMVFEIMPEDQKGAAAYTALISAYFSSGNVDKGLNIYKTMRRKGIHPALGTYNLLSAGLEKKGRIREAEIYRKEKKTLQTHGHSQHIVSMDEKICNLLFSRNVVS